jgi:hypothetical protein
MRTVALALLLTSGILLGIYHRHVSALIDPCQAVREYCEEESDSLGNALKCGADLLGQLFEKPSRVDCMRTWLNLNHIESPTFEGWLDALDTQELE